LPELPEVETIINEIRPSLLGQRIRSVEILVPGTIAAPSPAEFVEGMKDREIVEIVRRGKFLVFRLDNGLSWIVHLRMTGALLVKQESEIPEKFIRIIIRLEGGIAIHFRDVRRFGRMWLTRDESSVTGRLGREPLSPDFTPVVLAEILKNRETSVKQVIMDQGRIAGIGNMYADEALYEARLHPLQPAGSLTEDEIARLYESIQKVLRRGIHNKGASTDTYLRPSGTKGEAQTEFQVAHRKGEECPVCGGPIERIVVGQRGTFFCPLCQKLHKKRLLRR